MMSNDLLGHLVGFTDAQSAMSTSLRVEPRPDRQGILQRSRIHALSRQRRMGLTCFRLPSGTPFDGQRASAETPVSPPVIDAMLAIGAYQQAGGEGGDGLGPRSNWNADARAAH